MYKKIVITCLSLGITAMLTGCNDNTAYYDTDSTLVEATGDTYIYDKTAIDRSKAESVAKGFIGAIQNGDFETARNLIDLDDITFVSPDDIEYVVKRTLIGFMIDNPDAEVYGAYLSESAGTAYYSFYTNSNYNYNSLYTLNLLIDDNNNWSVKRDSFVKSKVYVYTPKDVRLFINDVEATSKYQVSVDNNTDVYCITDIARRSYTTSIVSSIFGKIDGTLEIETYNPQNQEEDKTIEINREITPELFDELGNRVMSIYNQIYGMIESNQDVTNLNQFIYDDKNYKFFEQIYQKAILARQDYKNNETYQKYTNTELLEFWQNPSVKSYVFSHDTIVLNMVIHLRWDNTLTGIAEEELICAGVKLSKNPGGKWLLNDITSGAWMTLQNNLDESQGVDAW